MPQTLAQNILPEIFIARQPIYDAKLNVMGYELLYRDNVINQAHIIDGNSASSQVVVNAFMEIGLDRLVGTKYAFINLTREFILDGYIESFPKEQVVLEVLEDVDIDDAVLDALRAYSEAGFTIALDDFVYRESLRPLIEIADIIKLDVMATDRNTLKKLSTSLRKYNVKLLAEKVETHEDFDFCKDLEFDYYQGYFFCQPKIIKNSRLPSNRLSIIKLFAKLQDPATTFQELEQIISQDIGLSYKLLRIINSASYGLTRKVESLHQALVILGVQNIKNWATLITMTKIDDKPHELIVVAVLRAKMCELLAHATGDKRADVYFTTGLFSILDAIMDRPLDELIAPLPLSDEINAALLEHQGTLGHTLKYIISYERGEWDRINRISLDPSKIMGTYLEALSWTESVCGQLNLK